ncbi:MAG: hypothetical protein NTU53_11980 [Planctomycetota bacterium]|nr:hypothetical protein [Planctomycetota bacterium]
MDYNAKRNCLNLQCRYAEQLTPASRAHLQHLEGVDLPDARIWLDLDLELGVLMIRAEVKHVVRRGGLTRPLQPIFAAYKGLLKSDGLRRAVDVTGGRISGFDASVFDTGQGN